MNNCILCNGNLVETPFFYRYQGREIRVAQCVSCKLGTLHPMLTSAEVLALYHAEYFERDYRCGTAARPYAEEVDNLKNEARKYLLVIQAYAAGKKYLELGCAGGAMLAEAQQQGFMTTGVEVSAEMADWGRDNLHVDIRQGSLGDQKFKNGEFDVVFLGDVIEHLAEPKEVVREIHRILGEKGIVALAFPMELSGIIPRLRSALNLQRESPDKPYHLFYYNLNTMRMLLEQSGFRVVYSRQEKLLRTQSIRTILTDGFNKAVTDMTGRFGDRGFVIAQKQTTSGR